MNNLNCYTCGHSGQMCYCDNPTQQTNQQQPDCPAEYGWIKPGVSVRINKLMGLSKDSYHVCELPYFVGYSMGEPVWKVELSHLEEDAFCAALHPADVAVVPFPFHQKHLELGVEWRRKYEGAVDEVETIRADNARLSEEVERLKNERDEFEKRLTESIYGGRSIAFDPDDEIATVETERDAFRQRLEGVKEIFNDVCEFVDIVDQENLLKKGITRHLNDLRAIKVTLSTALALLNENELTTLLAENARPTARVVELEQAKSDWERDCREVREMLWEIERIYDQNDLPSNYEDRDMYTRRVLNRFHIHQKDRGWDWGDGYQTLPSVPVELANLRNENVQNLQLLAEAKQIIESLHGQRTSARVILAGLGPVLKGLSEKINDPHVSDLPWVHENGIQEIGQSGDRERYGMICGNTSFRKHTVCFMADRLLSEGDLIVAAVNNLPTLMSALRNLDQALGVSHD